MELDRIFKLLGESSRLEILYFLKDGPRSVSQIISATTMSQPLVSFHLRVLREAGLVVAKRKSTIVLNELRSTRIITLLDEFQRLFEDNK